MAPSTTSTELRTASRNGRSGRKVGGISSARRPCQRTTTDHVAMQVKDALTSVAPLVDDEPVAAVPEAELLGNLARSQHDATEHRRAVGTDVANPRHVHLRN